MDRHSAIKDLDFIRELVRKTDLHIDPHAFHFVHWGAIVLIWYPLAHWFDAQGNTAGMIWTGVISFVLGMTLTFWGEARLRKKPRLPGENTVISNQIGTIAWLCVGAGIVLSSTGPAIGFIDGKNAPVVWGWVYAVMATMIGVVYRKEFIGFGLFIFVGVVLAMIFPVQNGYILGPFMGLGLLVPGLRAERRVRAMRREVAQGAE